MTSALVWIEPALVWIEPALVWIERVEKIGGHPFDRLIRGRPV